MKCQILFSRKNAKMFKMSAETKFNMQHFEIVFLFLPRKQKPVLGENINLSSPAELAQRVKKG